MARRLFTSESVTEGHPDAMSNILSAPLLFLCINFHPASLFLPSLFIRVKYFYSRF